MADWGPSHEQAVQTQLTRNDIVHLLTNPNIKEIVEGCFVRVLLEIETGHEDYRVFTIRGVQHGESYTGFSTDPNLATTIYMDLDLPPRLRGINGVTFQLNSISNSKMSAQEHSVWKGHQEQQEGVIGGYDGWAARAQRVQQHQQAHHRSRGHHHQQQPQQGAQQPAPQQGVGLMGTVAPADGLHRSNTVAPGPANAEQEEITRSQIQRIVMEELREKYAVFVNPEYSKAMKTAHLRMVERDLGEYLDRVRECLNTRPTCVVCMDRVPTVVLLPCKHMVLCRLCASQVTCCPCCRETAVEVFEPIEP